MKIVAEDTEVTHKKYQLAEWLKNKMADDTPMNWEAFRQQGQTLGLTDPEIEETKSHFSEVMAQIYFGEKMTQEVDRDDFNKIAEKVFDNIKSFYGNRLANFDRAALATVIGSRIADQTGVSLTASIVGQVHNFLDGDRKKEDL